MAIKSINKSDIDFNNIYSSSSDAKNQVNSKSVSEKIQNYWGDNGTELFFDDETGAVYEAQAGSDPNNLNGATTMGYINSPVSNTTTSTATREENDDPDEYYDDVDTNNATNINTTQNNTHIVNATTETSTTQTIATTETNTNEQTGNTTATTTSTNSNIVTINDNKNQYYTVTEYDKYYSRWKNNSGQRQVADTWYEQGQNFDHGIATVNVDGVDRYLVATTATFGKAGDIIDVHLKDGTTIPCIIADAKSGSDANWSTYGHTSGNNLNVLEWEVQSQYYKDYGNPSSSNGYALPWDSSSSVISIDNKGTMI